METLTLTEEIVRPPQAPAVPRASRRAVTLLFLVNGTFFATWVSRLPAIETGRGFTHAQLGLALFVLALGAMVAMPAAGWLMTRFGSDRICRIATLIYAAMLPLLALAPTGPLFALVLFGFGVGHGAMDVSMNAQAVAVEARYRRPIMSTFHALFSTGGLLGAAIGGALAAAGLTPGLHFALVSAVFGGLALTTLKDLLPIEAPVRSKAHVKAASPLWRNRTLLALGAIALCLLVNEGAMGDWSAIYLRQILHTSEGLAAAGYAAFSVAMAGGRFAGDKLAERFGPVRLVRGSSFLALVGLVLVLATPVPAVALLGFALAGAGFASVVPQIFSAAGHRSGVDAGTALATVTVLGYLGFLMGPPVIGFIAGAVGLHLALGVLFLTTTASVLLAGNVGEKQR